MDLFIEGLYQEGLEGRDQSVMSLHDQEGGELMIQEFRVSTT